MKFKRSKSKTLILILSALSIILTFSVCLIFIVRLGSFSVETLFKSSSSATETSVSDKNAGSSDLPASGDTNNTEAPTATEAPALFPDVTLPYASPNPDFVLSNTEEAAKTFDSPADIIEFATGGVVSIVNYHYNTTSGKYYAYGSCSGFIVSESGYIITNAHAVSDAKKLEVTFYNQSSVEAEMVGFDTTTDIAVIKIPETSVGCCLTLGNSDSIRVGEYVLAIGNPISEDSLYGSVSLGIISGKNRSVNIDGFTNSYIQTDAALNPGNSGGPLIDMAGCVIGMNTAKAISAGFDDYGNTISSEGIGFSIPINDVIAIANLLIQNGGIPRPAIGITVFTLTAEDAEPYQLVEGVFVDSVNAGSPAETAGLKPGDVIVSFNGEKVTNQDALVLAVKSIPVGDSATISVYREGKYLDFTLVIGNMNDFNY